MSSNEQYKDFLDVYKSITENLKKISEVTLVMVEQGKANSDNMEFIQLMVQYEAMVSALENVTKDFEQTLKEH